MLVFRKDIAVHKYAVQDLIHAQNADFVIRMLKNMIAKKENTGRFPEPCSTIVACKLK